MRFFYRVFYRRFAVAPVRVRFMMDIVAPVGGFHFCGRGSGSWATVAPVRG